MSTLDNNWVIFPKQKRSAPLRLICFPNAGGGGSVYRMWAEEAHPDIEVGWVLWPGRESRIRETPFASIDELIPPLTAGLLDWLDGRVVFYGHSLGARVAFEVSRELRRRKQTAPHHLFVGACQAPQLPWPHTNLHQCEEEQFIEQVQIRYGGIPQQVLDEADLRALLIPGLRADVRLVETYRYRPEPPLSCPITAFGGASDPTVDRSMLEAWRCQTSARFEVQTVPGDHFFVRSERRRLLSAIAATLTLNPTDAESLR
jgi:medium-chain acyl-[acyl-carrier-protein] hydrolase